jgi:hypothetical protein
LILYRRKSTESSRVNISQNFPNPLYFRDES